MLLTIAASLMALQPHAEPRAAVECASARVTTEQAESIGAAFRSEGGPEDAQLAPLADAVVACTGEDRALRRQVFRALIAESVRASLRGELAGHGVDMDLVDRSFDALPAELRTTRSMMEENAGAFAQSLIDAGADGQVLLAHGQTLGLYLGARVGSVRARLGLPD